MKRILLLLSLAVISLAQVQTIPNTNFPAVRTLLNSNFSWLNTNKASASATLTLNGVTITLGASNSIATTNITEGTNLYFTNARALSAMAGLYEAPLTFNSSHFTRATNTISLKDCANDGYVWKWRTSGGWGCEADQTGEAGGGITTLNTLNGATQTFSRTSDTNVTLTLTPSGTDHNFALGWSGTLAISRGGTGASSTSQNFAFIGPTSGSGAPSFRALAVVDIPTLNQSTTGNAATATALAANGANCSAGQIPLGVTAAGAAEGCYTPAISTLSDGTSVVTLTGSQTLTNKTLTVPIVGSYTVATLPAATTAGQIAIVTDAATAGNCGTGSGSSLALCRASGSAWVALGDGGSGHTQNTDTGTTQTTFQIDSGNSGPKLKNNAGVLEARNAADDDYADFRAKTISAGDGSVAGEATLYELSSNGSNYVSWLVPDAITNTLRLKFPNADPAASALNCAAPSSNISACTWLAIAQAATASTLAQRNSSGEVIAANTVATGKTAMATDTAVADSQLAAKHKTRSFGFILGADDGSALVDTNDQGDIWANNLGFGVHITQVICYTDSGTSTINLQRNDGSAASILSSNLTCSTSGASTTTFASGEDAISDTHRINLVVVSAAASGTPKRITVMVRYTVD